MDKFLRRYPWRVRILKAFEQRIGKETIIPQAPGERMFKSKTAAVGTVQQWRGDHGMDVCTDVYKAGEG